MLDLLTSGLSVVFAPKMFILIIFAVFLGTLFGALPGVSATMAVTLGIPFTYKMDAVSAIAFLVAIYCASITGGGMTAILFKIPGVPSSAPTTYDGYPMAQRGEAGKALGVQLIASAIGGMFAAVCMLIFSPQLTQAALSFGPSELFAISFMGLSILTSLEEGNVCRTIISGLLGLLLACIGLDPLLGVPRLTFGTRFLTSGIEMIPVMIGFFAVTEVLKQTNKPSKLKAVTGKDGKADMSAKMPTLKEMWSLKGVIARCSILGTVIGILPGAGATIASFLCYSEEQKISKHPEKFGTGCLEGIAAPESGNNAATGGSMVPLLSLGIPGGNAAAIMLSALVLITLCVFLRVTGRSNKMIFPPLIIMLCVTFTALVQRLLAMVKAISAAASTTIPAGETTWGAVFIANGLQLILAVLLIVLGLTIVIHSFKAYAKSEKNSESAKA